jgi:hypothetical protein
MTRLLEELELWDSLIVCYTTMDKKLQALEIIKQQLEVARTPPSKQSLLWSPLPNGHHH